MKHKCLSCKYEPDWNEPSRSKSYPIRTGKCKYKMNWPQIPWVYVIQKRPLIRYDDDSGLPTVCETWHKKED